MYVSVYMTCSTQVSFDVREDAESVSRRMKLVRFPNNPPNWGPKPRAKRKYVKTYEKVKVIIILYIYM